MKSILSTLAIITVFVFSGIFITNAYAQETTVPANTQCAPGKLCNPLKYDSIQQLLPKILDIIAQIGIIVCTFFIIYAGYTYVTAGGDPTRVGKAHEMLLWSVIGTAVLLGAKVLASVLSNTVDQLIK